MTVYGVRRFATVLMVLGLGGCADATASQSDPAEVAGANASFRGDVVEMLPAGRYTYYRLRVGEGDERWVVVSSKDHRDAARLGVQSNSVRRDFTSRRLNRTFPVLHFATIETSFSHGAP